MPDAGEQAATAVSPGATATREAPPAPPALRREQYELPDGRYLYAYSRDGNA